MCCEGRIPEMREVHVIPHQLIVYLYLVQYFELLIGFPQTIQARVLLAELILLN